MQRFKTGWALAGQSWAALRRDRSLLVFPVLSTVFAVIAVIAIWVPTLLFEAGTDSEITGPAFYLALAATSYIGTAIAIFFNVALTACAARSLHGGSATVGEGINTALSRLGPILGWAALATTVGVVLRAIEQRAPMLGRVAVWLVGAAWGLATFFVIPVLALEGSGPVDSLKRSAAVVKARWGESVSGAAVITLATTLVGLAIAVVGGVGGGALLQAGLTAPALVVFAAAAVGVIVVAVISSALSQVFRVALYQYAVDGRVAAGFDQYALQAAFGRR